MSRYLPTASSWGRATACPASAALPQVGGSSEAAERGTAIHEYLRQVAPVVLLHGIGSAEYQKAHDRAIEQVDELEWRATCQTLDWETLLEDIDPAKPFKTEHAYCVDTSTGKIRFVGENIGRDYGPRNEWETATSLDVEAFHFGDGEPIAQDYKTGQYVGDVSDNAQLKIQCYTLATKYQTGGCWARITYIAEDGSVTHDVCYQSILDLETWIEQMHSTARKIHEIGALVEAGRMPDVNEGEHCKYCPAVQSCPAKIAMMRSALLTVEGWESKIATMTPDQLGFALGKVKEISKLVEAMEKRLKQMATEAGGLPAGDGYEWRISEMTRPSLDMSLVRGKLLQLGGTDEDIQAMTKTTSYQVVRKCKIPKEKKK